MADGSISFAEGLGFKAQDSNELRRKQKNSSEIRESSVPIELQTPLSRFPKSTENPSLSRKLQQGSMEEREARDPHGPLISCESDLGSTITNLIPSSPPNGFGAHSPKSPNSSNTARKLQQVIFEEGLKLEAEARVTHVHGNTYQFQRLPLEVQNSNPNPKILFNTRGNPYIEGDPNLGYSLEDTKSRNAPPQFSSGAVLQAVDLPNKSSETVSIPKPQYLPVQHPQITPKDQPHQPHSRKSNPNPVTGQSKPKPKNWASLLQSQSPSLDMKLDYFPDLQRGKEALVEIELEMTEVGKWNRYLVGHLLDGKMAYPLLFSTARNQWKDLFVAVKPDVAGFYLFEFRDEQAKLQVLEGGPYFFSQKYLVLKDWHRMLKHAQEQPSKIPAWVKFHDLPFELWNKECLSRVASTIGRPLHVDQATAKTAKQPGLTHTKSTKARICIEINAEHDLPEEVTVVVEGESVIIPVEYQVLPPMCNVCHVFGHSMVQCAKKASTPSSSLPKLAAQNEFQVGNGISALRQQHARQEWVQVRNGKQKAVQELPKQRKAETVLSIPGISRDQPSVSDHTSIGQEHSDSDVELLVVLEKVVSSTKEAETLPQHLKVAAPLEDNKPHQIICTDPVNNTKTGEVASITTLPKTGQLNPKPPDLLSTALMNGGCCYCCLPMAATDSFGCKAISACAEFVSRSFSPEAVTIHCYVATL